MDYGSLVALALGDSRVFSGFYNLQFDVCERSVAFHLLQISCRFQMCAFRHVSWKFLCLHLWYQYASDIGNGVSRYIWHLDISVFFLLDLQYLWRSLVRNLIFRVVLGLSSLKGSGALMFSHPTRWTLVAVPISGCWPLGWNIVSRISFIGIFMRRGEVSEIQLYWERAAILFEQSLFLKQVWYQFRLSVRITSFLTIHERHRLILVSKYIHFERAELGFGVTELREGLEVSSWEVPSPPVEPCGIPEPVPDLESWLNQIGQ